MRVQARLREIKFDLAAYKRKLDRHMTDRIMEAAREWLKAIHTRVFASGGIRVWSTASIETFRELASKVAFSYTSSRAAGAPNRGADGRAESEGELITDKGRGRYRFRYGTTLFHLVYNEFNNANLVGFNLRNPGPYSFTEVGRAAFERIAAGTRLPNPYDMLRVKSTKTIK